MTDLTVTEALDRGDMLAPYFSGETWATWRAVLKAAEGHRLTESEEAAFRAVADRDPPARRVRELWVIAGRRAGKDSMASAIATVAAMGNYAAHLRPGERATVMCLACDRAQARIVLRYVNGYFQANPLLKALVEGETDDGLELTNGVEIVIATNSFRAVRGRSIVCAIFDETAFWRDESSANPDLEVYNAVLPGLVTLPGSMLVGISSPYRRSGLLFDRWKRYFGTDDPDVLVVRGPSTAFNPSLPREIIDQAIERDPQAAAAEWLGQWRSDLEGFVSQEVIDAAIVPDRHELPPTSSVRYVAFVDPSGGSADSMTLAVSHREGDGRIVLDAVRERRPPFSPEATVAEFVELLRSYRVREVIGDRYAGEWPREQFRNHKIEYKTSDKSKSDLYREMLPLLNSGRVELLDSPRLAAQLVGLERRTARGGRDSIDHAPGAHDDLANAVAGAVVNAAGDTEDAFMALWKYLAMKARAELYPDPKPVKGVYAKGSVEYERGERTVEAEQVTKC